MLFAETADRDARGGGIIADEVDRLANDCPAGGIAFGDRSGDAGELRADGLTDIDRELRTADAFGLVLDGRTYARDAFAPIGERAGGVPFIDLGFGRQDDRRPSASIEQTTRARRPKATSGRSVRGSGAWGETRG